MLNRLYSSQGAPRWVRYWFGGAALYATIALLGSLVLPLPAPPALLPQLAFTFTALAFQIVFGMIAFDPVRYRPLMLAGVVEKLGFAVPVLGLAGSGGCERLAIPFGVIDLVLGAGFFLAWRATPRG